MISAAEVVDRREVVASAKESHELGDVGAHLLPGPVGGEVAPGHVLRLSRRRPLVGAVPGWWFVRGVMPQRRPISFMTLRTGLVRYADAVDGAYSIATAGWPDAVRSLPKISATLARSSAWSGPSARERVVVVDLARPWRGPSRSDRSCPSPESSATARALSRLERSSALRAIDFFRYATRASSLRTRSSEPCSRVLGALFAPDLSACLWAWARVPRRLLAVQAAPALSSGDFARDPEARHRLGLGYPIVDHGRALRRPQPVIVSRPFPAHLEKKLRPADPYSPAIFSASWGTPSIAPSRGRAEARVVEVGGLEAESDSSCLHLRSDAIKSLPFLGLLFPCPRNGRQFTCARALKKAYEEIEPTWPCTS